MSTHNMFLWSNKKNINSLTEKSTLSGDIFEATIIICFGVLFVLG